MSLSLIEFSSQVTWKVVTFRDWNCNGSERISLIPAPRNIKLFQFLDAAGQKKLFCGQAAEDNEILYTYEVGLAQLVSAQRTQLSQSGPGPWSQLPPCYRGRKVLYLTHK